jgi:hypothetical protein
MEKKLQTFIICCLLFIASCGDKNLTVDNGVYFQDFDNLEMWARDQWNLTNEIAHSGNYSARTDSNAEYSQTFELDYAVAKAKGFKSMQVTAWLYADKIDPKAGLVTSVETGSGAVAYASSDIKNYIAAPKQWEKISCSLNLPDSASDDSKIKVYLCSPGKAKIFMDDVTVKFLK